MYVYMVRSQTDPIIKDKVVSYLLNQQLPNLMQTGCFLKCSLEVDHATNEIISRYECESEQFLSEYLDKHSVNFRQNLLEQFPQGIKVLGRSFSKIMCTNAGSSIN